MKTFETEKGNSDWWKELSEYALNIDGSSALSYQFDGTRLRIHKGMNHDQWLEFAKLILNGKCKIQSKQLDAIEKVEWNGEGLPPVGVECELKYKHSSQAHWNLCRVFAYSNEMGMVAAIWHWFGDKWKHATIDVSGYEFRAIESQEAKKERERNEVIHKMVDDFLEQDLDCSNQSRVETVCAALYDAGYRKGE